LAVARVGRIALVAQEKHERTRDARPNDATQWSAVHIDPRLAPGIVMAELCGRRPTEGVAEYSHARHVEPSRKRAGRIGAVQLLQPIEYERDVASAHGTPPCVLRTVTKYRRAVAGRSRRADNVSSATIARMVVVSLAPSVGEQPTGRGP